MYPKVEHVLLRSVVSVSYHVLLRSVVSVSYHVLLRSVVSVSYHVLLRSVVSVSYHVLLRTVVSMSYHVLLRSVVSVSYHVLLRSVVSVSYHVLLMSVVSVSYHYNSPAKFVGFTQNRYHHHFIKKSNMLSNIYLLNCLLFHIFSLTHLKFNKYSWVMGFISFFFLFNFIWLIVFLCLFLFGCVFCVCFGFVSVKSNKQTLSWSSCPCLYSSTTSLLCHTTKRKQNTPDLKLDQMIDTCCMRFVQLVNYNCISGVIACLFASSVLDRGFEPRSDQIRNYKIGICHLSAMYSASRTKRTKTGIQNRDNVSEWNYTSITRTLVSVS
jgi:hypothetical protein